MHAPCSDSQSSLCAVVITLNWNYKAAAEVSTDLGRPGKTLDQWLCHALLLIVLTTWWQYMIDIVACGALVPLLHLIGWKLSFSTSVPCLQAFHIHACCRMDQQGTSGLKAWICLQNTAWIHEKAHTIHDSITCTRTACAKSTDIEWGYPDIVYLCLHMHLLQILWAHRLSAKLITNLFDNGFAEDCH